jgi:ABC-type siderophore export system fused ATPase/permease subunit
MKDKDIDQEHYNQLFELYKESGMQFDKQILYISSGALGLSLTFITDIVEMKIATNKCLLSTSWIILVIIIFLSLTSHYISMKAMNHRMENLKDTKDTKSSFYNKIVSILNITMLLGLPVGIAILLCFITFNL